MYRLVFTEDAQNDLRLLQKNVPQAIKKLKKLLEELQIHLVQEQVK